MAALLALTVLASRGEAQDTNQAAELGKRIDDLQRKLDAERAQREAREQQLLEELGRQSSSGAAAQTGTRWYDRFTFGGYGEIHFNRTEGSGGDQIDLTRFVGYVGYRFSDWIQFDSEIEIEHGLVAHDGDGEVAIEQAKFDFAFTDGFNVRAGRFLTPLGIVNETHEPTTFNGVERPLFDTVVIPTTWSADGIGVFGRPCETLKYQLYLQSSLDGSGFDTVEGIREGRQEGSAGMSEPGISGRLDWYAASSASQNLRLGLSSFFGGLNNGAGGVNPGVDADIAIYSADFQYSVSQLDFRGAYAFEKIGGAADLGPGIASEIDGWMLEGACHVMPESWKAGKLEHADVVVFARYDAADTQKSVPGGVAADPAGKQDEVTIGLSFFPVENLVIKMDYQIRDDDTAAGLPERFNIGIGWRF